MTVGMGVSGMFLNNHRNPSKFRFTFILSPYIQFYKKKDKQNEEKNEDKRGEEEEERKKGER